MVNQTTISSGSKSTTPNRNSFTAKLRSREDELAMYENKMSNMTDHTFRAILTLIAVILLLTAVIMFLVFKNR